MARNITYEVLVQQGTRWEIHARHGAAKKEAALNEAKALERLPNIRAVKVVKETYDTVEGDTEEATVYKSVPDPAKSPYRRRSSAPGGKRTQGEPLGGAEAKAAGRKPARKAPSTKTEFSTKVLLVLIFSIAFAAVLTGIVALIMRDSTLFGSRVSADVFANVLFGVFVVGFLFSALPLAVKFLSKEELESNSAAGRRAPAPRKPAGMEKKIGKKGEKPSPPPIEFEMLPTDEQEDEQPEVEEHAEEQEEEEEEGEEEHEEPAAEEPPSDDTLSPGAEKQKVYMMTFLGQALGHVKTANQSMDTFNKFGVNLFLAGACEAMSGDRDLDADDNARVLGELVEVMGFKKDQATAFAKKCDEYLLADSRYMQMYQAGRNAMNTFMGGDTEGARQLQDALVEWDKPKPREADTGPITVMFTDMVGSTNLTQTRGDEVAQQVVRVHNRVVRDALNKYGGTEVKHTGDGIMASFPTTSNGVDAAVFIQQKTAAHNRANAELALHLKIGINAGEPIIEDGDLFGTTVQLAARIVDKASTEQIFVSEIVRGICAGKDFKFSNIGGYEMKGFAEPITLFEVLWQEAAQGQPDEVRQAPKDETEQTAAPPAVAAAKPNQEAPAAKAPSPTQEPVTVGASTQAATPSPTAPAQTGPTPPPAQPAQPAAKLQAAPRGGAPVPEAAKQGA